MRYYLVKEGQGVAGPEHSVSATTTPLYTCMGLVMRNEKTKTAGLYHYPAKCIEEMPTQQGILSMINDIKPNRMFVTRPPARAHGFASFGADEVLNDAREVKAFLKKHLPSAEITWHKGSGANYFTRKGSFVINKPHAADKLGLPPIPKGTPTACKFTIGDTTFYVQPPASKIPLFK